MSSADWLTGTHSMNIFAIYFSFFSNDLMSCYIDSPTWMIFVFIPYVPILGRLCYLIELDALKVVTSKLSQLQVLSSSEIVCKNHSTYVLEVHCLMSFTGFQVLKYQPSLHSDYSPFFHFP